ncbi:MAG: hypothetical protein CVV28_10055 [Methanobacteriales archaeon HGW-Methanobacteriales-1]|nr:MAG: hypothetical protein CVV28_10055 [Methanobacteriales archaeon HGW-Methanobacteriales-1]
MTNKIISFKMTKTLLPLLLLALALVFTMGINDVSAAGDTIYVNDTGGNDDNDGSDWLTAKKTILNATGTVNTNGIVNIANGQYNGVKNTGININKNMTINGESQTGTIINGTGTNGIFTINPGINVKLNNLTLTNGNNDYGGAIHNYGNLTVTECTFTNNTATGDGGAIYNEGNLTVTSSTFTNNTADLGGAIYNNWALTVTDSDFINNTAPNNGGAIYNNYSNLTVTGSTFTNNTAQDGVLYQGNIGGAIFNNYGNLTVTGSTFNNNIANGAASGGGNGGAIINMDGNLTVSCSTFTNNTADLGGAIANYGNLTVTSSTFNNNTASYRGGAIYNSARGTVTMSFCQIVGNTQNDIYNSVSYCNAEYNWWGTNFNGTDPVAAGRVVGATVTKWLVLTITANPTTINNGATSEITADLLHDQNGDYYNPVDGHVPDGIIVTFNTDKGSVGSKTIDKETSNGTATATLNADETVGIAHVNAVTDNQIVNTDVNIKLNTNTTTENKKNLPGNNVELKAVVKDIDGFDVNEGQVKFTVKGITVGTADVVNGLATLNWTIPSNWAVGTNIIQAEFLGTDTYSTSESTANLTVDLKPVAWANVKGGLFNVNKNVYLSKNKAGTIYYTRNGSTPTTTSSKYAGYLSITASTTLKFILVDLDGNVSPIYTEKYVIDKTAPKVTYTYPKNLRTGQSRTATLYLKFSEKIKTSTYWSKIYVKNLKTGKKVSITKYIKGNILYIKTKYKRPALRWFQVYMPYKSVKDYAGNNLVKTYTYKFKTRS